MSSRTSFRYLVQQSLFIARIRHGHSLADFLRKVWFSFCGMKIGRGTDIPKIYVVWPHQVNLGKNCILERGIFFKFDGIWKKEPSIIIEDEVFIGANCEFNISGGIRVGKRAMIASGCKFIDHNHGMLLSEPMNLQAQQIAPIAIGEEAWLGVNVIVLKGVNIGKGAVVAAGSVVLSDVGENEIFGGVPARLIRKRN